MAAAARNLKRGAETVRLFEIGRRYLADGERPTLGLVLAGDRRPRHWASGKAQGFDAFDAKAEALALLAAAGAPVLNDPFYGDPEIKLLLSDLKSRYKGRAEERPLIARLALHASELTIKHPETREPFVLQAPLPNEFEVALKYLRKFAVGRRR